MRSPKAQTGAPVAALWQGTDGEDARYYCGFAKRGAVSTIERDFHVSNATVLKVRRDIDAGIFDYLLQKGTADTSESPKIELPSTPRVIMQAMAATKAVA